jgi:hypothetical protein
MARLSSLTLFPLLSIMVAAMGTLAFLAIALGIVQGHTDLQRETSVRVRLELDGAPPRAQAFPVECRSDGVTLHAAGIPSRFFPVERLRKEVAIVRDLHDRSAGQAGGTLTRDQEWLFFKAVIERDARLKGSLTLALHLIEMANLKGDARNPQKREYYPILMVFADGVVTYDLVSFLLEATSRLPAQAEPMLPGWGMQSAQARMGPAAAALPRRGS